MLCASLYQVWNIACNVVTEACTQELLSARANVCCAFNGMRESVMALVCWWGSWVVIFKRFWRLPWPLNKYSGFSWRKFLQIKNICRLLNFFNQLGHGNFYLGLRKFYFYRRFDKLWHKILVTCAEHLSMEFAMLSNFVYCEAITQEDNVKNIFRYVVEFKTLFYFVVNFTF